MEGQEILSLHMAVLELERELKTRSKPLGWRSQQKYMILMAVQQQNCRLQSYHWINALGGGEHPSF